MIGLLQSGTGTGNGIWRPSCASGLLEELFADVLCVCARAAAFAEEGAPPAGGEPEPVCLPDPAAPEAAARCAAAWRRMAAAEAARRRAAGEVAWLVFAVPVWATPPPEPDVTEALVAVSRALAPVDVAAPAPEPEPVDDAPDPLEVGVLGVGVTGVLTVGSAGVVTVTGGSVGVVTGGAGAFTCGTSTVATPGTSTRGVGEDSTVIGPA
jgi:hypothetical protein